MDYEEMSKAYKSATYQKGSGFEKSTWGAPNYKDAMPAPTSVEVDYSIIKMPDGTYVVARSERLGSLDYDYVCTCPNRHEARDIVRGLNK